MGFIQNIFAQHQRKVQERDNACNVLISRIESAICEAQSIFSDSDRFIDPGAETNWKNRSSAILVDSEMSRIQHLRKSSYYQQLFARQSDLHSMAESMSQQIHQHNEGAASMRIEAAQLLIGDVEGQRLDRQQMICIVKEVHNHLVIAGAGTGKTTTIVGKIKYLLMSKKCLPQDILVLSFTNASATEMKNRIVAETGYHIAVSTFHKLGLNIISETDGIMPKITQINLRKFVREHIALNMQRDGYLYLLSSYLLYNRVVARSEFEFKTQKEYDEYLTLNPPTTVNNEIVKSYGEMDIANFLAQNGVEYVYEYPYEIDTRTREYGQYHPDFYLPEYKIYIEYFGINRKGEVPSYFKSENGMTASEMYRASMEWKRAIHREHGTIMIECYAYEKWEGKLLDLLKQRLEAVSVVLKPKSPQELWTKMTEESDSALDGIIELFETLINLIKSNGYEMETVRQLNCIGSNIWANDMLLSLLEPVFDAYCKQLSSCNEIDFNDMINMASDYVRQGKYSNPYKYVIVDEYQDISKSRFTLLDCLRKSRDYDLFCVGDDWQSIYRFAGSDIGFILNFTKYWGATEISRIETTYRFSQKLIDISSGFIMQNPLQIKKYIQGKNEYPGFPLGEISGYTERLAIEFMSKKLNDIPRGSNVFFIGRYAFDAKPLHESGLFICQYNNISGFVDVKSKLRPDLKIVYMTAHKSKGLQADYIFIINNKGSRMGFPSKIQDAPILALLLDNCDPYPYAEERRLFYVALTRARKKAFIVTIRGQESEFALELKKRYEGELSKERFECPLCGGKLIKHSGPYGEFFGCSNYRTNGCTYKRKI